MPFWYWLVLAALLGVIEVAVPAMVCIWLAGAALGTAAISWIAPGLAWEHQALIFAALAVAGVALGRIAFAPPPIAADPQPPKPSRRKLYRQDVHHGRRNCRRPGTA